MFATDHAMQHIKFKLIVTVKILMNDPLLNNFAR